MVRTSDRPQNTDVPDGRAAGGSGQAALIRTVIYKSGMNADQTSDGKDNCNSPLASMLPHSSFQGSSQSSGTYAAYNAKLNRRDGAGGWTPMVTDQDPWLQVDLKEQMEVTSVATQGRYDSWDWVSSYQLLYSDTGRVWKQYRQEDGVGGVHVTLGSVV
ncbi:Contactin-associated protein-like 4 [Takifugu flavidus]|uniref:Contactin-associated protein-like 4 n=1 Tax=Takifugu flavidus TaxID=433684 RepID=A0A5C6PNQ4_9TELE|nr:Contactin-associated protein-like 4 [Takifugu flavidus]